MYILLLLSLELIKILICIADRYSDGLEHGYIIVGRDESITWIHNGGGDWPKGLYIIMLGSLCLHDIKSNVSGLRTLDPVFKAQLTVGSFKSV